jgi:YD repeat-containing protein
VPQGATDPTDWVWRETNTRWERGSTDTTAIDQGANYDQNRITDTVYDLAGRVQTTRDNAGRLTYTVYDALGRRVRSIANYEPQATGPENWVWANNQWEDN